MGRGKIFTIFQGFPKAAAGIKVQINIEVKIKVEPEKSYSACIKVNLT
jgi:hypothetical protein